MMKPDLNLLVVFEAVAAAGSVTAAAARLGLSQPAVSHALNRLRATVGDPLFTKHGRSLVLTPCAQAMQEPTATMLRLATTLLVPQTFRPEADKSTLRIAASDYATLTLVPRCARLLLAEAPFLRLEIVAPGRDTLQDLASGALDISFWGTGAPDGPYHYLPLFREQYVGVARKDHPIFGGDGAAQVGIEAYLAFPHAVVSMRDPGANQIEQALQRLGRSRRIGLASHSFAGNIASLKDSDYLANLPLRLCQANGEQGLRMFRLPFDVPSYAYGLVWHHRTHLSPKHVWIRELLARSNRVQQDAPPV